jgi:hypothetical protein
MIPLLGELRFTLRSFYKVRGPMEIACTLLLSVPRIIDFAWQFTLASDQYHVSQVNLDALPTS